MKWYAIEIETTGHPSKMLRDGVIMHGSPSITTSFVIEAETPEAALLKATANIAEPINYIEISVCDSRQQAEDRL